MLDLNTQIFEILNTLTENNLVATLSPLIADFPIFFIPLFLSGLWIYHSFTKQNSKQKHQLLYIFYACVTGIVLSYIIKMFVDIERPDMYVESTKNLIMNKIPEKSFPSDHATVSFAFVSALFYTSYKKVWYFFLPLVIIMNISRIIVGVHWPLDILVGSILWIFSAYIFFTYIKQLKLVKSCNLFIMKTLAYIGF